MLPLILKNISWLASFRAFELLISLTIGIWLVRYLGPSDFGLFSYVIAIGALMSPFIGLGVPNILSRELLLAPNKRNTIIGTAFWIWFISGFIGFVALNILAFLLKPTDVESLILVFVFSLTFVVQAFGVVAGIFESRLQSKLCVKSAIWSIVISNVIKVLLIVFSFPVLFFIIVSLIETIIRIAFMVYYYFKIGERISDWKWDYSFAVKMIKSSWPLMFSGVMVVLYMKIDQVMIGLMLGDYQLGLYSVSVKLAEIAYFLPGVIMLSLFPSLMSLKKLGGEKYLQRIKLMFSFMTYFPFILIVPVLLLSQFIVTFLYGVEYLGASVALSVSIFSLWAVFVKSGVDSYLLCENKTKIIFIGSLIGAISNILLNLILIPLYGIVGAALATVFSYALAAYVGVLFSRKTWPIFLILLESFDPRLLINSILKLYNNEFKLKK